MTPFYLQLAEELQYMAMTDNSMEKYVMEIIDENTELKNKIQQLLEINKRLMSILKIDA